VALDRIRREVRTARQIAHPSVCRVYDIAQTEGHVFLSMEYVDGDDLSHVLRRLGRPSKDKAIEIARQLCLGLAAAHENKVLHRDLKPANVMLDGRGRVRITDFGLAGLTDELEEKPQRAGTPAYMAPEQLESGMASVQSDIYSLGLVLYELFTGKQAFVGRSREELRQSHSSGSVPSMQSLNDSIDPAIERVVLRCLEPDPADRPPSVFAILAALPGGDPLAAALAAGETPSPEMLASARGRGGLSPRWAVSMFAFVLLALGLSAILQQTWTIAPEMGRNELGMRAREMLRDLGHELPRAEASGLISNWHFQKFMEKKGEPAWVDDDKSWPPPYFYWHRLSPVSLHPNTIHSPIPRLAEPLATPPGSLTIVLGSGGELVELEAVPEPVHDRPEPGNEPVDWSFVLEQAGLDPDGHERTAPARAVPPYCDEVVAFLVVRPEEKGGDYVFQAGAHRGRVVHATTKWEWNRRGPLGNARNRHYRFGLGGNIYEITLTVVYILSALLAWHNLRLGRGDRRGAIIYGVVVFLGYLIWNAAHARITETGIVAFIVWVVGFDPIGHASMHAIHTTLLYLAIEPYVRKIWPNALIAWARLARGQWKDPAVARETLIGITAFVGGTVLAQLGWIGLVFFRNRPGVNLYGSPFLLGDFAGFLVEIPHSVALAMFFSMVLYFVFLIFRLLTRRDWATILVPIAILVAFSLHRILQAEGDAAIRIMGLFTLLVFTTLFVLILIRVGLIAAMVFLFVFEWLPKIPLTLDTSEFFAPQGIFGLLLLLAIVTYGFRYSLAGQSVFTGMLGDGSDNRSVRR
jgi:serine/threonine-protein kinase